MSEAGNSGAGHPGGRNDLGGVVHGPAIQAQSIGDVHLFTSSSTDAPVPRQLPPPPPHFTGRSAELAELDRLAASSGQASGIAIIVIVAGGGSGKTALASQWMHSLRDRYEGGSLFADLRGHELADAADPGDVAAAFLRALGVAPERIPLEAAEQSAVFRSVTAGRGLLILLDNAASAAQVRLLLPGPGPDPEQRPSLVVVTTRLRIAGLALDGASFLELGPLDEPAALDLFDRMVGPARAAAEPDERSALVRLSGGLPLAVCVTAAKLAAHPRWPLSRVASELADERGRLPALSLPGDVSVRAAFDIAYRGLEPAAQRAYRMTAMIPGAGFDTDIAAATLAGNSDPEPHEPGAPVPAREHSATRSLLDALADASLLNETGRDRFQFHDLTQLHARECADEVSGEPEAALTRSIAWYLARAVAADLAASPGRWRLNPMYDRARAAPPAYDDAAAALDWLEARLPDLIAAVKTAHGGGLHEQAWQLCEALWNVFLVRKHFQQWISADLTGLAAARACRDPRAQAQMHCQLGFAFLTLQRFGEARQHFLPALELSREHGHALGMATALEQLGIVDLAEDAPESAITRFTESREILRGLGRQRGVALATRRIGEALRALGLHGDALRELAEARRVFAELPDPYHETRTLTSLAQTLMASGRSAEAVEPLETALGLAVRLGSRYEQARIARHLGRAALQLGDVPAARRHLAGALSGFEDTQAPDADDVRGELASLDKTPDTTTT